jgi:hypothetical protein
MPEDKPESMIHSYESKLDEILAIVKRIEAHLTSTSAATATTAASKATNLTQPDEYRNAPRTSD